ncbi:MAG: hypothetical protein KY476_12575 [Planctomycetes bacterium]|nr:hypothetical protein [Planctomycetota bacterium]
MRSGVGIMTFVACVVASCVDHGKVVEQRASDGHSIPDPDLHYIPDPNLQPKDDGSGLWQLGRLEEQPRMSDPATQPSYDRDRVVGGVGQDLTLIGSCGNASIRWAVLTVALTDGTELPIDLSEPWPTDLRDEYESCGECDLCAEVEGKLLMHDGELYFVGAKVSRFWRRLKAVHD